MVVSGLMFVYSMCDAQVIVLKTVRIGSDVNLQLSLCDSFKHCNRYERVVSGIPVI
jgi:hypothetical protein